MLRNIIEKNMNELKMGMIPISDVLKINKCITDITGKIKLFNHQNKTVFVQQHRGMIIKLF